MNQKGQNTQFRVSQFTFHSLVRNPAASPNYIPSSRPNRSASIKFDARMRKGTPGTAKRWLKSRSSTTVALKDQAKLPLDEGEIGNDLGTESKKASMAITPSPIYMFSIEECILEARKFLSQAIDMKDEQPQIVEGKTWNGEGKEKEELDSGNAGPLLECPRHGRLGWGRVCTANLTGPDLGIMCPDLLFSDLENEWSVLLRPSVSG